MFAGILVVGAFTLPTKGRAGNSRHAAVIVDADEGTDQRVWQRLHADGHFTIGDERRRVGLNRNRAGAVEKWTRRRGGEVGAGQLRRTIGKTNISAGSER